MAPSFELRSLTDPLLAFQHDGRRYYLRRRKKVRDGPSLDRSNAQPQNHFNCPRSLCRSDLPLAAVYGQVKHAPRGAVGMVEREICLVEPNLQHASLIGDLYATTSPTARPLHCSSLKKNTCSQ
jgi:hypothetical protein